MMYGAHGEYDNISIDSTTADCSGKKLESATSPLFKRNTPFPHYGSRNKSMKHENVTERLASRKELFSHRKYIADYALIFAMTGITLMIFDTEFCMANVFSKDSIGSIITKTFVTLTTLTLLFLIVWYHQIDIKVFMIDNSIDDWRLAINSSRIFKITIELLVCAVHPLPGKHDFTFTLFDAESHRWQSSKVPIDVIFSLPMFLRFYLMSRVLLLHSRLFQDASSQSLGALNQIHFNFRFIFKSLMNLYPEYIITILTVSIFIWASWAFRACEMYHSKEQHNFFNSMWLIAITFLSIGYGDIVPVSYCGRGIAVLTGIFGAACTALTVAILTQKLELSQAEKYVHNFVINLELGKNLKHAAANIVKEGWLVYKYKVQKNNTKRLNHQRRLLQAIRRMRQLRDEQRKMTDNSVNMGEILKHQTFQVATYNNLELTIKKIESQLEALNNKLDTMMKRN